MPEAITKYALNSTLGTNEFQPLDQMIVGQKMFVASDTPIVVINRRYTHSEEPVTFAEFSPKINGTLKLTCWISNARFRILEDETTIDTASASEKDVYETVFNISKNKKYSFKLSGISGTGEIGDFKLSGDIVDSNWFEFEEFIMP